MHGLIRNVHAWTAMLLVMLVGSAVWGQSSSLYVQRDPAEQQNRYHMPIEPRQPDPMIASVRHVSMVAVPLPPPRQFQLHDLVTVIIRESTQTDFSTSLETEKESRFNGEISDFPNLNLAKLAQFILEPSNMEGGNPKVGIRYKNEFDGEGQYRRRDNVVARVTARIIDIKPNGTMVLEARKNIQSDGETAELVLTGVCRADDITVDNTVLSTQLYDLNLNQQNTGELRRSTRKGLLTRFFELLFNF